MSARLLLYSAPQSCEPSSTCISSVWITRRSSSLTSRPVRTAPTFSLRPASTGSRFVPLNRKTALRDITFRFGSRERLLMMLSVKPSDRYSAFGSLVSLTNGRIATELIGRGADLLKKSTPPPTARTTNNPTRPYESQRDRTRVTPGLLGTVARSVTVCVCDLIAVRAEDVNSVFVSSAVENLVSSGNSEE